MDRVDLSSCCCLRAVAMLVVLQLKRMPLLSELKSVEEEEDNTDPGDMMLS